MSQKAIVALIKHVAYESIPSDRGGKHGPKGRALAAFIAARNAALDDSDASAYGRLEDLLSRFEAAFPEYHFSTSKGRPLNAAPSYTATITADRMPLGAGESTVSLADAFEIAFRASGLEWPRTQST